MRMLDLRHSEDLWPARWIAHQFDALELAEHEQVALSQLREALLELRMLELSLRNYPPAPKTGELREGTPEGEWQYGLEWLLRQFFVAVSRSISALSGMTARVWHKMGRKDNVPTASLRDFLQFLSRLPGLERAIRLFDLLAEARDFRNFFEHPQQHPQATWATVRVHEASGESWRLVYYGRLIKGRRRPQGTTEPEIVGTRGDWELVSPDATEVADAIYNLVALTASLMSGHVIALEIGESSALSDA